MDTQPPNYHYDYRSLDKLLTEDIPPERFWKSLDEIQQILMHYLQINPVPPIELVGDLHYETRVLRDVFGNLKPWHHGNK